MSNGSGAARDGEAQKTSGSGGTPEPLPLPPGVGDTTATDPDAEEVEKILWVTIEIPRGSRNKYEYDDALGRIRLDRTLHSSVVYPTDYGFVPETLAADGDHLDVLVVVEEPTFPGCLVPARVIGLLEMDDEKGQDEKVLAVPVGDPRFLGVRKLQDLPAHWLREIEAFFATYKLLEDKQVNVKGWHDADAAWKTIARCRSAFNRPRAATQRDV